jgi:hypothetical protein
MFLIVMFFNLEINLFSILLTRCLCFVTYFIVTSKFASMDLNFYTLFFTQFEGNIRHIIYCIIVMDIVIAQHTLFHYPCVRTLDVNPKMMDY